MFVAVGHLLMMVYFIDVITFPGYMDHLAHGVLYRHMSFVLRFNVVSSNLRTFQVLSTPMHA